MNHQRYLALDIQSTGASPTHGSILEIGWALLEMDEKQPQFCELPVEAHLLPQQRDIPRRIRKLTGIDDMSSLETSPADRVKSKLGDILGRAGALVIHYAQFETRFLTDFLSISESNLPPVICTHKLSKQLHPSLPNRGIRALSGYYGQTLPEEKRVTPHVRATALIWRKLREQLPVQMRDSPHSIRESIENGQIDENDDFRRVSRTRRLNLPESPGLYLFYNPAGQLLYIGKAKNLRSRVNSYFQGTSSLSTNKKEMFSQVDSIETLRTESALEATIAEPDKIKEHSPPYNSQYRRADRELCTLKLPAISKNVGPFTSPRRVKAAEELLHSGPETLSSTRFDQLFPSSSDTYTDTQLEAALKDWFTWHNIDPGRMRKNEFEQLGRRLWLFRRLRKQLTERTFAESPDHIKIIARLNARFRSTARQIRRGRWFALLRDSRLVWESERGDTNSLYLEAGRPDSSIIEGEPNPDSETLLSLAFGELNWSLAMYDRLAALTRELKRLTRNTRIRTLETPLGRLHGDEVSRVLFWI